MCQFNQLQPTEREVLPTIMVVTTTGGTVQPTKKEVLPTIMSVSTTGGAVQQT